MTSKSTNKDYKALYDALKTEHDLVLKKSTIVLKDALKRLEGKDAEIAKVKAQLKAKEAELAKYKEAEKAYKTKFSLEETWLTLQEMKEMERRAREDEDEDDDRPLAPKKKSKPKKSKPKTVIDLSINHTWYEDGYCPICYNDISIDDKNEDERYDVCGRIRYFFK